LHNEYLLILQDFNLHSVGKIAEKAVCRSVFMTTWHCIWCRINKNALLQTVFLAISDRM